MLMMPSRCEKNFSSLSLKDHVKTRKVKVRTNNSKWMNGEIRKTLNNCYKLLNRAKGNPRNGLSTNRQEIEKRIPESKLWSLVVLVNRPKVSKGNPKKSNIGPLLRNDTLVLDNAEKAI